MLRLFSFKSDSSKDLFAHLKYLSQLKRFESQIMFLTNEDKRSNFLKIYIKGLQKIITNKFDFHIDIKFLFY